MNSSPTKPLLIPLLAVTLLVICNTASAQGTASGPFTVHEVQAGPIVLIGSDINPIPIDLDPTGLPWTKGFFDPLAWAAGNVTVDLVETILNVGTESWSDWHEHIIGDPLSANGPSFWSNVVDIQVNGTSMTSYNVSGIGTKDLDLDGFFPLVQPGDILTIHKQIDVFNVAGETSAPLVRMEQYPTPEPASAALIGLGTLALLNKRRKQE